MVTNKAYLYHVETTLPVRSVKGTHRIMMNKAIEEYTLRADVPSKGVCHLYKAGKGLGGILSLWWLVFWMVFAQPTMAQESGGYDSVATDLPLGATELNSSIGQYWKARQLLDSIDLCRSTGLAERLPDLNIELASLLRSSGNLPESYSLLHELLAGPFTLTDHQRGRIFLVMANVFYEMNIHVSDQAGLLDSAYAYTRKVQLLAIKLRDMQLEVDALNLEGGIDMQRDEYTRAVAVLLHALQLSDKARVSTRMAILANLAHARLHQQNYQEALRYSDSCKQLAVEEKSSIFHIMAMQNMGKIYTAMGDTAAATAAHRVIEDLAMGRDIVLESLMVKKLLVDHRFREAGKQVETLGMENFLLQKYNRTLTILLLVILLAVIIITILVTKVYRKNKQVIAHKQLIKDRELDLGNARLQILEREHSLQKQKAEQLKLELDAREQEMVNHTLREAHIKQLNNSIHDKMTPFVTRFTRKTDREEFSLALSELYVKSQRDPLKDFEQKFISIHNQFYEHLFRISEDLTPVELQVSALLRTNLSSKDIAGLMNLSVSRIDQIRHQIRAKLNIDSNQNLVTFLHGL